MPRGSRRCVRRRARAATSSIASRPPSRKRLVMGGATGVRLDDESPAELVDQAEDHLRALLRDVLCGYLVADLKGVADDILLSPTQSRSSTATPG